MNSYRLIQEHLIKEWNDKTERKQPPIEYQRWKQCIMSNITEAKIGQ